jgi:diguanylate cyclase (GGDEF)-like protein
VFSIDVSRNEKGINFEHYNDLKVWTRYNGVGDGSVRLEIRGANPEYTVENNYSTLKYNEIQYSPKDVPYPLSLKWQDFSVPNWWISEHKIPLHQHKVDVSDVRFVEFHTGEKVPMGKGQLEIIKLELRGKWLNRTLYSNILLSFWIGTWSLYLLLSLIRMRQEIIIKDKQKQDLLNLNELLYKEKNKAELKAKQDELTGLLNRYGLYDQIVNMLEKPKEGQISILFIDIDHFKLINDTKGHPEGDRILKAISSELSKLLRREDILARWGGEEFLIVCKTSNKEGLLAFGQKLLTGIRGLPDGVTCSIGGCMGKSQDFQKLVENADRALYKAKNEGRNRMVLCDESC